MLLTLPHDPSQFTRHLVYLLDRSLLSIYYMSDIVLYAGDKTGDKKDRALAAREGLVEEASRSK